MDVLDLSTCVCYKCGADLMSEDSANWDNIEVQYLEQDGSKIKVACDKCKSIIMYRSEPTRDIFVYKGQAIPKSKLLTEVK